MQWIGYTCGPLVNQVIQAVELSAVSFLALSLLSDSTGSMVCEKTAGSWGLVWEAFLHCK